MTFFQNPDLYHQLLGSSVPGLPDKMYSAINIDDLDFADLTLTALDILKETNTLPKFERLWKSENKSNALRAHGNKAYVVGRYQTALKFYNQALLHAPTNSKPMLLVYSNRSALFLKTKNYGASLRDINTCMKFEASKDIQDKLEKRKEDCMHNLCKERNRFVMFSDNFFKLDGKRHPLIPCITNDVNISMDVKTQLPKVTAGKDMKIGTVVGLEKAFTTMLNPMNYYLCCYYCHKMSLNLIPCRNCVYVLFCNEECMNLCMKESHCVECRLMELFHGGLLGPYSRISYRTVIKIKLMCETWKEFIEASYNLGTERMSSSPIEEIYDERYKFSMLNFVELREVKPGAMYNFAFMTATFVHKLISLPFFLPLQTEERNDAVLALARMSMGLLLKFYNKIELNLVAEDVLNQEMKPIVPNYGYFAFTSKLRHSCDANLIVLGVNQKAGLVTVKPIKKGTELTICYVAHAYDSIASPVKLSIKERVMELYRFAQVCRCPVCTDTWQKSTTLNESQRKQYRRWTIQTSDVLMHGELAFRATCELLTSLQGLAHTKEHILAYTKFRSMLLIYQFLEDKNYNPDEPLFPTDPSRKRKWVEAVQREKTWISTKYHRICSMHFEPECYKENKKQRKLYKDAIPTLNLPEFEKQQCCSRDAVTVENEVDLNDPNVSKKDNTKLIFVTPVLNPQDVDPNKSSVNKLIVNPLEPACSGKSTIDSPKTKRLKQKIREQDRQMKRLQYKNRRLTKKVANMQEILDNLTHEKLISDEDKIILEKIGGKTKDLLSRIKQSCDTQKVPRTRYSPELRTFALTLHFYSTRAYKYVRKTFNTCLPAPRTLQKWYSTIDGKPGFTSESLKAIKERVGDKKVYGALILDEMKIMESEEFHPASGRTYRFEDFGFAVESDCNEHATEVLVFLVVALNQSWKVPIGYFATSGVSAEQKAGLILTAINLVQDTGLEIKSLTFDGPRVNLATAKKLGCVLDPDNLKTFFENPVNNNKIYVFLDPCHMLKNVRNAFEAYGTLQDSLNRDIKWNFLEDLQKLQDNELFHLANKLRANHVHFKTKIMNVRLASQLFSESVANALTFCETQLKIVNFYGAQATADFLKVINDIFDILDSRVHQYGLKRALNTENHQFVFNKLDSATQFLNTLKYNGSSIMKSGRFTGFLGFCVCAESAKGLFHDLVLPETEPMQYLPLHKISQDHLEIFFSNVRSHGGRNDNPTVRVFESIYKKMLVHLELIDVDSGNCIALEKISILNCSSTSHVDRINQTTARLNSDRYNKDESETGSEDDENIPDLMRAFEISPFGAKVVEYIAGFVAHKLIKKMKCDTCISALLSLESANESSLITQKDKGKLIHPSNDLIFICRCCETELRKGVSDDNKLKKEYTSELLLPRVFETISKLQIQIFNQIDFHRSENDNVNHVDELGKAIAQIYFNTRIAFIRKQSIKKNSKKHIFKKLVHNKSQ